MKAHNCFFNYRDISYDGEKGFIHSEFIQDPAPRYFDGKFSTTFESCIKDKFKGLETINEVRSDYIKRGLIMNGIQPENRFAQMLNPELTLHPEV